MEDTIVLDNEKFYAYDKVIGIDEKLNISEGYDDGFTSLLSKKQKIELADRMLNL